MAAAANDNNFPLGTTLGAPVPVVTASSLLSKSIQTLDAVLATISVSLPERYN